MRERVIAKMVRRTSSRSLSKPLVGWEDMRWKSSLSSLVNERESLDVRVDMAGDEVGGE